MTGTALKKTALLLSLVLANPFAHGASSADWEAQETHRQGSCGSLGPGEGGKGRLGRLDASRQARISRPRRRLGLPRRQVERGRLRCRPAVLHRHRGAAPGALLERKMLGRDWQPVAKTFLYPPQR